MCGICGWIETKPSSFDRLSLVEEMNASLRHRGPDDADAIVTVDSVMAMSRLSIIDLNDKPRKGQIVYGVP